ncbi:MAG: hypothetical protein RID53_10860 [Coleofasciculus sp. B1-GNL1-01]|uniref:hypothetical protein n=1 Tax=Coleofasciculus sp. B1-GNL1-01 TaxID=3068484 RepID=UPI003300E2CE
MPLSGNDNRDNLLNIPINLQPKKQTNERQFERKEPLNLTSNSLQLQLREIVQIAWTTEDSFRYPQFLLNPNDLAQITTPSTVVEVLLRHVERIAPGFNVPYMVPRVLVTPLAFVAGLFEVDEEGWVTIKVGSQFFANRLAAQAILAHEVCHYILENSGIRKNDFTLNERYTDLCMFVCGFGQIFLAGYKEDLAQREYRPGHRLGYLTDAEYESAQHYVMQLRQSGELAPPSELDTLKKQLAQLVYDKETCKRIIKAARRKYPHKPELELYRDAIERLERDRGR